MTRFEFGDIVLVPFPFTDYSTTKKRPAVVISSDAYNSERLDLIIMAVTSQIRPTATLGEVIVQDWQTAGLLKPIPLHTIPKYTAPPESPSASPSLYPPGIADLQSASPDCRVQLGDPGNKQRS